MTNILFISPNFTIGGTEGQIFNIATRLDRSRFTPSVISVGINYGQQLEYERKGIEARSFKPVDFLKIASFAKQRHIDIVHSFYYGNFSGWDLLMSKLAGVKIFVTSRRSMGYWRKPRHLIFDSFRNNFTDVIVANSYAVRDKAIADEKIPPSKIIVIYNGIDLSKYADPLPAGDVKSMRNGAGIEDGCKTIGMISNIKSVKGYEYFLRAAKTIKAAYGGIKFVIAGDGSEDRKFVEMVKGYGLEDSILLLGLRKDMVKVFALIDIFMYSSLSEGFPNIILEAMALGKPIISTDVGGINEMLQDGYSGILVPPKDAQALADAVIGLIDDEEKKALMGKTAKKTLTQLFTIDECVKQYEILYEGLFGKLVKR